jgi:DnaJ homolog subfamily C member 7
LCNYVAEGEFHYLIRNPLLIISRFQLNRHAEALVDTDASLALFPTSFKALWTRARIYSHFNNYDAAIADFQSAIQQAKTEGNSTEKHVRALQGELKKAEAALKRSKTKDYYKILGVARDCGEADIKKAYRRECLKHHPEKVTFFSFRFVFF